MRLTSRTVCVSAIRAHRVVMTQLLDRARIAARSRIHGADAEKRAMAAPHRFHSKSNHALTPLESNQLPDAPTQGHRACLLSNSLIGKIPEIRSPGKIIPRAAAREATHLCPAAVPTVPAAGGPAQLASPLGRLRCSRRRRRSSFSRCFLSFSRSLGESRLPVPTFGATIWAAGLDAAADPGRSRSGSCRACSSGPSA